LGGSGGSGSDSDWLEDVDEFLNEPREKKKKKTKTRLDRLGSLPSCDPDSRRPVCDHARVAVALGDRNPRYLSENVVRLGLDPTDRTTFDLFGEEAARRVEDSRRNPEKYALEPEEFPDPRDVARESAAGIQAVLDIAFASERGARLAPYAGSGEPAPGSVRGFGKKKGSESIGSGVASKAPREPPVRPASARRR
jgi:hypothetical protein